jgi:hypothetical protein
MLTGLIDSARLKKFLQYCRFEPQEGAFKTYPISVSKKFLGSKSIFLESFDNKQFKLFLIIL